MAIDNKLPPQALDAEMAVLGSMLIDKEAVETGQELLQEEHFYKESHRKIFRAVTTLYAAGQAIDSITVTEELRRAQSLESAGGPAYLSEIIHSVSTAAHVEYYARWVKEKSILRELISTCTQVISRCYEEEKEPAALLDEAQSQILAVAQKQAATGFFESKKLAHEVIEDIDRLQKRKEAVTGVPTGLKIFDRMTAGLQKGDLILIAARPSQGKTALALNIAANVVLNEKQPHAVAFYSLEMTRHALMTRLIATHAGADLGELRRGFFRRDRWTHITNAAARLSEASLFINDGSMQSVLDMRSSAKRLATQLKKRGQELGLIMIDYLQLMRGSSRRIESRQQEVSEISRGLKFLARDLNVPVVALSQLSRRAEDKGRTDGKPQLSDLRESGALEQDADLVAFIYREGQYKREDPTLQNKAEIIIAKQRNGPVGSFEVSFSPECTRFADLAQESQSSEAQEEAAFL